MFQKEYVFFGSHADIVKSLVSKFSDYSGSTLFKRNVDVLLFAPIVGLLFGRTAEIDKTKDHTTKIFVEQMIKEDLSLRFNYQLVTLLDKKNEIDNDRRIDCAFRNIGREGSETEIARFNEYILGGVEVLDEKLIQSAKAEQDYLNNLYDFLDEINDRYNQSINNDRVRELVALARS